MIEWFELLLIIHDVLFVSEFAYTIQLNEKQSILSQFPQIHYCTKLLFECDLPLFYMKFKLEMDEELNDNEMGDDFQIYAQNHTTSPDDLYFDEVVGALQDIMLDEQFECIQDKFMRKHCGIFEDSQQNKNEYMVVFNLYQQEIQYFVQQSLKTKVTNFNMQKFAVLLQGRTDQIDEQILNMIQSFGEFQSFKNIMLQYKEYIGNEKELKELTIKSNRIN